MFFGTIAGLPAMRRPMWRASGRIQVVSAAGAVADVKVDILALVEVRGVFRVADRDREEREAGGRGAADQSPEAHVILPDSASPHRICVILLAIRTSRQNASGRRSVAPIWRRPARPSSLFDRAVRKSSRGRSGRWAASTLAYMRQLVSAHSMNKVAKAWLAR